MPITSYVGLSIAFGVILCAIFASVGARQKGRSELAWFMIGLSCAPFALLVYAMPSLIAAPAGRRLNNNNNQPQPELKSGTPVWVFIIFISLMVVGAATLRQTMFETQIAELANFVANGLNYLLTLNPFKLV